MKDYKKLYEKSLKRAEEAVQKGCLDRNILDAIFPELTESEDEKIRKEINTLYSEIDTCISELLKARIDKDSEAEGKALFKMEGLMVATLQDLSCIEDYLEKQKEQKPVEKKITLTSFEKTLNTFLFDFANSPIEDCEPKGYIKKHSAEILKAAYKELNAQLQQDIFEAKQEGIRDGYEVARAEQKPAEWSKNDTAFLNEITDFFENKTVRLQHDIDMYAHWLKSLPERFSLQPKQEWREEDERMLSRCMKSIETSKQFADSDNFKKAKDKEISWFKDLPNRFNLQPKQEWSEEDEKIRDRIIDILNRTFSVYSALGTSTTRPSCPTYKDEINWLKSLRPQPKAELTLLDKNIIEAAVAFVKQNDHFNCWGGIDKHTVIKALRSLKPHWKPSEEQMKAFKGYIEDFQARAEAAVGGWNNFDVMIQLYEHLKKL